MSVSIPCPEEVVECVQPEVGVRDVHGLSRKEEPRNIPVGRAGVVCESDADDAMRFDLIGCENMKQLQGTFRVNWQNRTARRKWSDTRNADAHSEASFAVAFMESISVEDPFSTSLHNRSKVL